GGAGRSPGSGQLREARLTAGPIHLLAQDKMRPSYTDKPRGSRRGPRRSWFARVLTGQPPSPIRASARDAGHCRSLPRLSHEGGMAALWHRSPSLRLDRPPPDRLGVLDRITPLLQLQIALVCQFDQGVHDRVAVPATVQAEQELPADLVQADGLVPQI